MNPIAEQYVRLALSLGEHDANYVDAYFGPDDWRGPQMPRIIRMTPVVVTGELVFGLPLAK